MAERHFTSFYLGQDLFGIEILLVREINRNPQITPVEHAPNFIAGLMNLRGQIVTVMDLGIRLGLPKQALSNQSRCIVLKTQQELASRGADEIFVREAPSEFLGLLVDSVDDMVSVDEVQVELPPANVGQVSEKYLTGVVKLENKLVAILDIGKILLNG